MSWRPDFTEPQARHTETVLRMIDSAIDRVDHLLERSLSQAGSPLADSRLAPETIKVWRTEFRRLHSECRSLYTKYGLRERKLDVIRVLDAELSSLWEMLEDSRPRAMGGYGPMDPETASVLERDMARLVDRVLEIRRQVLMVERNVAIDQQAQAEPRRPIAGQSSIARTDDENSSE